MLTNAATIGHKVALFILNMPCCVYTMKNISCGALNLTILQNIYFSFFYNA